MTVSSVSNAASLAEFAEWVASRRDAAFQDYRQRLTFALSNQQREQLTQRAMLGAMEQVFHQAIAKLEELPFDVGDVAIERGRSALTPLAQAAFEGFIQALLDAVVHFNRASCALSNFPDEHRLAKDYTQAILLDIAAAWREFSLGANRVLIAKGGTRESAAA
jgi:monoamine oxidase